MKILLNWVILAVSIFLTAYLLPGIAVEDFMAALWASLGLGIINAIIKPIIMVLTLPINILTLGLLTFIINALLVLFAAELVNGFSVDGILWALLFSLVLSVINGILSTFIKK
ncbi:phage holin family protein [Candidatus Peregrinibacteria bacterium]|nr:phage holin family protein [Candidatus Peregrinibacteria bacterium]